MTANPLSNKPVNVNPAAPLHYFHIAFLFHAQPFEHELTPVLNQIANDWIRYTPNNWVVCTYYDAATWYTALKPFIKGDDQMIILELQQNQNLYGWAPQWIWDWLNKRRI